MPPKKTSKKMLTKKWSENSHLDILHLIVVDEELWLQLGLVIMFGPHIFEIKEEPLQLVNLTIILYRNIRFHLSVNCKTVGPRYN